MATATHNLGLNWSGGGVSFGTSNSFSGSGEYNIIDTSVTVGVDREIGFTCDVSELQSLYMHSDREVTVYTNVVDPGTQSVVLKADLPYIWYTGPSYYTLFMIADVTKLYVDNASGATATLNIRAITDATP